MAERTPPRRPSSGSLGSLATSAPWPATELHALRVALRRAQSEARMPEAVTLAGELSVLVAGVVDRGSHTTNDLVTAIKLSLRAEGLGLGDEVGAAAVAVREALGVAGAAVKDARERVPTPPPTQRTGERGRG